MKERLTEAVERYLAISERHGVLILGAALLLAVVGAYGAIHVRVDARVERLLPAGTPSARAVRELQKRTSVEGPLYLLVTSSSPELNRQLARRLREAVERWPETLWAIDRRDPTYFQEHALLFAATDRLETLTDDVEGLIDWEECEAIPYCINFVDRPEEPTREDIVALFEDVATVETLASLLGVTTEELFLEPSNAGRADDALRGELCNPDGTVCAVQAVLDKPATDVGFSVAILERSQELMDRLRPAKAPPDLRMVVAGRFRGLPMSQSIVKQDLKRAAALGFVLVATALLTMFRGPRAFVVLLAPITLSVLWTLGLVGYFRPDLNLISASVLALLLGLGVDFGVHVLMRYGASRKEGSPPRAALQSTMQALLGPMTVAAATTGAAFAALAAARFRGFAEMGPLGALGVSLAFLAFLLLFPPLILGLHQISPERRSPLRVAPRRPRPRRVVPAPVVALGGIALAVGLGWIGAQDLEFEHDFRRLRPAVISAGVSYRDALHGTSRTPVFLIADNPEELEAVAAQLREHEGGADPEASFLVVTPHSFTPPDQVDRLALIERLRETANRAKKRATPRDAQRITEVEQYLEVRQPVSPSELPQWVRGTFAERDGTFGRIGIWYAGGSPSDAYAMERLAKDIEALREHHPGVRFASTAALLGEVVPGLKRDAPLIIGLALVALLFITFVAARSWRRTLLVAATLAIATGVCVGLLALFGLKIDLYNMLVFPLAFGIGVDGAIYVVWRYRRHDPDDSRPSTTARAVLGSTLTDAAAFSALGVAVYPGLVSVASVALVTLGSTLFANLVWLPAALQWRSKVGS